MTNDKIYLGNGAYCEYDGWQFVLTAQNGISTTDTVCLEPNCVEQFLEFVRDKRGMNYLEDIINNLK